MILAAQALGGAFREVDIMGRQRSRSLVGQILEMHCILVKARCNFLVYTST
jgi:hypothetical protein